MIRVLEKELWPLERKSSRSLLNLNSNTFTPKFKLIVNIKHFKTLILLILNRT